MPPLSHQSQLVASGNDLAASFTDEKQVERGEGWKYEYAPSLTWKAKKYVSPVHKVFRLIVDKPMTIGDPIKNGTYADDISGSLWVSKSQTTLRNWEEDVDDAHPTFCLWSNVTISIKQTQSAD